MSVYRHLAVTNVSNHWHYIHTMEHDQKLNDIFNALVHRLCSTVYTLSLQEVIKPPYKLYYHCHPYILLPSSNDNAFRFPPVHSIEKLNTTQYRIIIYEKKILLIAVIPNCFYDLIGFSKRQSPEVPER